MKKNIIIVFFGLIFYQYLHCSISINNIICRDNSFGGQTITLCFDRPPICNFVPNFFEENMCQDTLFTKGISDKKKDLSISFIFPMTVFTKDVKKLVAQINATYAYDKKNHYSLSFESVDMPIKGIKCNIYFDPTMKFFIDKNSIRKNFSIVLSLCPKSQLTILSQTQNSICTVV